MVKPVVFEINEQTIKSNFFSKPIDLSPRVIQEKALLEFNDLKDTLKDNGIEVLIVDDALTSIAYTVPLSLSKTKSTSFLFLSR